MAKPSLRTVQFVLQAGFFGILLGAALVMSARYQPADKQPQLVSQTTQSNAQNVPAANHFKVGLFLDTPTVTSAEKKIGSPLNIIGWFVHWNASMHSAKLTNACSNGYVPEITWESWSGKTSGLQAAEYPLANIADGQYDNFLKQQLRIIQTACPNQTVLIRFDHEMNTAVGSPVYYPWQGDPSNYVAAWQHIVGLSRAIDPQIKWVWSIKRGTAEANQYYPGSASVDYVGITFDRGPNQAQIPDFASFYTPNRALLEGYGKPVLLSEVADMEGPGADTKAQWISGMFHYIEQDRAITGLVWFNAKPSFRYDSSPASLTSFSQGVTNILQKEQ